MVLENLQQKINALLVLHDMDWKKLGRDIGLHGMQNVFDDPDRHGRPSHLAYLDKIAQHRVFPKFIPIALYDSTRMANGGDKDFPRGKHVPDYVGRAWKQTRKSKGIDLLAVAADLKIPYLTLTGYETGSSFPQFSRSTAINNYLGLKEKYFVPARDIVAVRTEEEERFPIQQSMVTTGLYPKLEVITDVPSDVSDDELIDLAYHDEQPDRSYDMGEFVTRNLGILTPKDKHPISHSEELLGYREQRGILTPERKDPARSDFNIQVVINCLENIFSK